MTGALNEPGSENPRQEAFARVGGRFDVRVLEPSPPARQESPWFADDPVAPEPRELSFPLVSPVPNADRTWNELAHEEPELAQWCADRWLGAWRGLPAPVDDDAFRSTRASWHALAEQVLAPARRRANGKIGLRFTRNGFGTPFFAADHEDAQIRVEGSDVVVVHAGVTRREPISTIAAAARMAAIEPGALADLYKPATSIAVDAALTIEAGAAGLLGDWFGFGCSVLEETRVLADGGDTRTQVWPEHFDMSVDLGDAAANTRGTFGASPGDPTHAEPYLYVTHWAAQVADDTFWNDKTFGGASLGYRALLDTDDPRGTAIDFFRRGLVALGLHHG